MRSPSCGFRNRLIALSICLCALLAFSTTLRADIYTFVPGHGPQVNGSSLTYTAVSTPGNTVTVSGIGPYGGTLTDTSTNPNRVLPDSIFFCLTGNHVYNSSETDGPNGQASLAPTTVGQEEAAFLYSLMLSDEATRSVTLSTTGTPGTNSMTVVVNGTSANISLFEGDLGPIQLAIWYVMGTLPDTLKTAWGYSGTDTGTLATSFTNIKDAATQQDVFKAAEGYASFFNPSNPNPLAKGMVVFTQSANGQDFIGMVPEPGTMILFGTGVLLMGLGSTRKLLARRRAR